MREANREIAVIVKMNLRDGFEGGVELDESKQVAVLLEAEGVDALVLSGGFTSKAPMYVMRGAMPMRAFSHYIKNPLMRLGVRLFGGFLVRSFPFSEGYLLDDALKIREVVKLPLIYVGGLKSKRMIGEVLEKGFDFIQVARALVHDTAFISKIQSGEITESGCNSANFCIAHMYSGPMICYQHHNNIPGSWKREFDKKKFNQ